MVESLNRFWQVSVHDQKNGMSESRTHYLDPWCEMMTSIFIRNSDYNIEGPTIEGATIEVMRTFLGKENNFKKNLDSLIGTGAYKGAAKRVLQATAGDDTGLWAGMLLEGVKALRQSRMFIWEREGFDFTPYLPLIENDLRDSCIRFSTPEGMQSILNPSHLLEHTRGDLLFSRYRYCFLQSQNLRQWVTVGLADSFHEMTLNLELIDTKITSISTKIIRAPQEICFEAKPKGNNLIGKKLSAAAANEWARELQGSDSCTHLADLAREAASSLNYWYIQKKNNIVHQNFLVA